MTRRLGAMLALAAAMMMALPTVGVSQSDHSQEELSEEVVDALVAGRTMPTVFGGLWLEGMTVVAAFTEEASGNDKRTVTDEIPSWATYRTEEVTYSEAELREVREDVSTDARSGGLEGVVGIGVDIRRNAVEISVLPELIDDMDGQLRETYGRVRLELVASEPDQGAACTRYDCWNSPLKGGISIDGCTSTGVMFKDNGGGSVSFRLLTAGHCTQSGSAWTHDGHSIGATTSTRYFDGSECDCQAVALSTGWDGHKYLKNNNNVVSFHYRKQRSAMMVGTKICQSGKMAANRRCGELVDEVYDSWRGDDNLWLRKMAVADFDVEHGDSGGPVSSDSGKTAWGLISGIQGDGDAVFSPIEGTEIEWDEWKLCVSEDSVGAC